MNGPDLLTQYRECGAETAFSELVQRYGHLVYSVAKRQIHGRHLAEEVAQEVFTRLARSTPRFSSDGELVAWLHRTTVHVAIDLWRSEVRRQAREEKAATMEHGRPPKGAEWTDLAPHLDAAINQLGDLDRQAILIRFFEHKPMREVGLVLGVTEDAAKMRVSRAMERLRIHFAAKGITCGAAVVGELMLAHSVEAAPSHLITQLQTLGTLTIGASSSAAAFSGVLSMILMTKSKVIVLALVLAGLGLGVGLYRFDSAPTSRTQPGAAAERTTTLSVLAKPGNPPDLAATTAADREGVISELDKLKGELRALLQRPQPGRSYPPPRLRELLHRFGEQVLEAVPILVNALTVPDYETRLHAASGLRIIIADYREEEGISKKAFELARPALAHILQSPDEPALLRLMALQTFVPPIVRPDGLAITSESLFPGAREDLLLGLKTSDRDGFGFTMVDHIAGYLPSGSREAAEFNAALQPMLNDGPPAERLVAAYALASWPGDKPAEVKAELLRAVREPSPFAHHAADALARLGADALDAVPDLLACAEATKDWGGGYANRAIEAACRLNPTLRAQYPQIDETLKSEEQANASIAPPPASLSEWIAGIAKMEDAQFAQLIKNSIPTAGVPGQNKETFLTALQGELAGATDEQRPALARAIQILQEAPVESEAAPPRALEVSLAALTMDARVLLNDEETSRRRGLEQVLEEFDAKRLTAGGRGAVTAENYAVLSKALADVDPAFQVQWRKAILKNYPWLDRVISPETK